MALPQFQEHYYKKTQSIISIVFLTESNILDLAVLCTMQSLVSIVTVKTLVLFVRHARDDVDESLCHLEILNVLFHPYKYCEVSIGLFGVA